MTSCGYLVLYSYGQNSSIIPASLGSPSQGKLTGQSFQETGHMESTGVYTD